MFANERQEKILKMLLQNGAVTTAHLVEVFEVSIETIRRDLLCMEKSNLLKRVHGGAVSVGEMKPFNNLKQRNTEHSLEKRQLALKAAESVQENDYIFIDAGSTAIPFAEVLREKFSSLTVVTHSMDVFQIMQGYNNFSVILCGGYFNATENAFCGALAMDMLEKLHVQKSFIFPSALSIEFGICDYLQDFYQIQKQMMKNADNIYILADSSKFEKRALLKLDDMKPEYHYVTDSMLPEELQNLYRENNLEIYIGECCK